MGLMVEKFGGKLLRSRQENVTSPSGMSAQLKWASLCFEMEKDLFVTVLAKGSTYSLGGREDQFKVTVTADTANRAAEALLSLQKQFVPVLAQQTGPSFFVMGGNRPERVPLADSFRLNDEKLSLHYGEEFSGWAKEFLPGLDEPGISILCGEPGTGKTYFIRHIMAALADTHRFYFVPVDNFGLLSSNALTDFWKLEHIAHPSAKKVLVLEDAEVLLRDREKGQSAVATILNLTDGLMTQYVQVHLLATLNCSRDVLDPALLRPGRLKFFRNFGRLPAAHAARIARLYSLKLPQQADYSLAEIFAAEQFQHRTSGVIPERKPLGFSPGAQNR